MKQILMNIFYPFNFLIVADLYLIIFFISQIIFLIIYLSYQNRYSLFLFSAGGTDSTPLYLDVNNTNNQKMLRSVTFYSTFVLLFAAVIFFLVSIIMRSHYAQDFGNLNVNFCFDTVSINYTTIGFKFFLTCIMLLFTLFCYALAGSVAFFTLESFILMWIVFLGGLLLFSANSFLVVFIALELISIPLYILVGSNSRNNYSTEAGIKYLIIGAVSSSLVLLGFSFLYHISGVSTINDLMLLGTNFSTFPELSPKDPAFFYVPVIELALYPDWYLSTVFSKHVNVIFFLGWFFLLAGLLLKMGIAPFHFWMPDVYVGAPSLITLMLMTVQKFIMWVFLFKMYCFVMPADILSENFSTFLTAIIILNVLLGIFPALYQDKFKKLLVYSGIGANALLLLPFGKGSIVVFTIFLLTYLLNTFGLFSFLFQLKTADGNYLNKLSHYKELSLVLRVVGLTTTLILLSTAGLPPTFGFISKFLVYYASFNHNFIAVACVLLGSVAMTFYYFRVIRFMYVTDNKFHKVTLNQVFLIPEYRTKILLTLISILIALMLVLSIIYYKRVILFVAFMVSPQYDVSELITLFL